MINLNNSTDIIFIIWLIGAIVSTYCTFKYARAIELLKFNHYNIFCIFIICGYTLMSWIGAYATYMIFKDEERLDF